MSIATAPRNKIRIKTLGTVNLWFAGLRYARRKIAGAAKAIERIVYYPEVEDLKTLSDVLNRAAWYFPISEYSDVKIVVPVSKGLEGIEIDSLIPPSSQENYLKKISSSIELADAKATKLSDFDVIMLWDKRALVKPGLVKYWHKVSIVDPTFYSLAESEMNRGMYFKTIRPDVKEGLLKLSKDNYERLLNKVSGLKKGFIFGTGPSIEEATEFDFSDGFNVICNSVVKNKSLLSHIKPHLLVFADPVFHFSPCKYSAKFRRNMLDAVKEFGCYVMMPDYNLPLILAHYPELKDYAIGMPVRNESAYNFPTTGRFFTKVTNNVMTLFMLPVASEVADQIYIIGSDGRKPDENYFWKHSKAVQFDDLMETAFETHPSFFRDRIYTDYYAHHCKILEEMIEYGEKSGKKYYSLTPSYIPALSKRPAM